MIFYGMNMEMICIYDMVQGSFISHYLHDINIESKHENKQVNYYTNCYAAFLSVEIKL